MKAPDEVILMGYWLTEARTVLRQGAAPEAYGGSQLAWAYAYLTSAMAAESDARQALSNKLENRQMLPSDGLRDLYEACDELATEIGKYPVAPMTVSRIEHLVGRGHQKLARMMHRLGFDPITNEDFQKLRADLHDSQGVYLPGAGGGR